MRKFDGSVSCPGLYGGLYGQNLPYKFKNSYGDFWNHDFEKSHRSTGPRSDLRPDLWSWTNSGLDSTFGNVETGSFWVTTRGASANEQYRKDVCTFAQYSCVYICPGVHGRRVHTRVQYSCSLKIHKSIAGTKLFSMYSCIRVADMHTTAVVLPLGTKFSTWYAVPR